MPKYLRIKKKKKRVLRSKNSRLWKLEKYSSNKINFIIFKLTMYLLHWNLVAKDGKSDELIDILLQASELVSKAKGCKIYLISKDKSEKNSVYITEIWDTKQDHDNSLNIRWVKDLIVKAISILEENPNKWQELEILWWHIIK